MTNTTKAWLHSIVGAAVSASANAITVSIVDPEKFNLTRTGLTAIGTFMLVNAVLSVAMILKQSPLPDSANVQTMNKTPMLLLVALLIGGLTGCVPAQTKQAAQAAEQAAIIVYGFQQTEIVAHNQHLIPDDDHIFIQAELVTLARAGKAADSCIGSATTKAVTLSCVNAMITTVDQINTDGGLHLKSERAKTDFNITMVGVKTALQVITTFLGGAS